MKKREIVLSIFAFLTLLCIMSGCSTIEGFGKDVASMASWTRNKLSPDKSINQEIYTDDNAEYFTKPGQFAGNRGY